MIELRSKVFEKPAKNGAYYLVAVDGRGGSGKTILSKYLKELLPGFVFINGDDYFEPATDGIAWGKFNESRFENDITKPLHTSTKSFSYYPYDWQTKPHITERAVKIEDGLCLERVFSFELSINWDLKIWIDTPRNICFERGIKREHQEGQRNQKAWRVWQTDEDKYIARIKPRTTADIIIDGTRPFAEQLI